ncbi:MAG: YqgE/AlgH family protein [Pseudomonadota bacterium]
MQNVNLARHFLIAMPAMTDPHFAKSLTYICEHNDQGALGVVVNRPLALTVHALFEQVGVTTQDERFKSIAVHFGGPVQVDRGFVLHSPLGAWQSTLCISEDLGLTTSKDVLEALARGAGPHQTLITLGYSGWAPGQLEHELAQNAWLTVQAQHDILFDLPSEERLAAAMEVLGVDYTKLSGLSGHA